MWDIENNSEVAAFTVPNPEAYYWVMPEDWQILAVKDAESNIIFWDVQIQTKRATFKSAEFGLMRISPDGKTLAYIAEDGMLRLWDISSRAEVASLAGHVMRNVVFSPDGQTLLMVGLDSTIRVWQQGE